jgi:CBS domain-containing protein
MIARDIMTTDVVTVSPDTRVEKIAILLLERHISGVPVTDEEGRVVGIVSEADLIGGSIRRDLRPKMMGPFETNS